MTAKRLPTVMLVDDNCRLAAAIGRSFRLYGYTATIYSTMSAATSGTRSEAQPAAALIDLHLDGGSSGLELAYLLRARWPMLPVCVFSGYKTSHLRSRCHQEGIDVVDKGEFNPRHFLRWVAIGTLLRRAPRHLSPVSELCNSYDLPPQEAKIVAAFAAGVLRSKLPIELALRDETVNKQVRRVLRKFGVTSSDELCGMLLRVTGEMRTGAEPVGAPDLAGMGFERARSLPSPQRN